MKMILKERGKTTELIKLAAETKAYIACHNTTEANRIEALAAEMGLKIRLPITYREVMNYRGYQVDIYIDNIEAFLSSITPYIKGFSVTPEA